MDLEGVLRLVHSEPANALAMPVHFDRGGGLGGAAHTIQTIATWALRDESAKELTLPPSFGTDIRSRERLASTLPGMAALYFSDKVKSGGATLDRYQLLKQVAPRVEAMQSAEFSNTLRGQGVALCCFAGAKNEFISSLYAEPASGNVRGLSDFELLSERLLTSLGRRVRASVNEGQLEYLSGLLHQLFHNADEHGSFDQYGQRYSKGMRGLSIRLIEVDPDATGTDPATRLYLGKLDLVSKKRRSDEKKYLLEVSVFDTGPGLALRWLGELEGATDYASMERHLELDAVYNCFKKHATTKPNSYVGEGLSMALSAMKKLESLVLIRTGRMSLYQDFLSSDSDAFSPHFRHGKTKDLAAIAGTSITICFPV